MEVGAAPVSDGGTVTCYVGEEEIVSAARDSVARIDGGEYAVAAVAGARISSAPANESSRAKDAVDGILK